MMSLIYLLIVVVLILIVIFVAFRLVGAQTEETQIEQTNNQFDQLWQFLFNWTNPFNSENIITHQTDGLNLTIPQIHMKVP